MLLPADDPASGECRSLTRLHRIASIITFVLFISLCLSRSLQAAEGNLDLTRAVVVAVDDLSAREKKAVAMLVDEVRKRTMIRWAVVNAMPTSHDIPVIVVGPHAKIRPLLAATTVKPATADANRPEGYQIVTKGSPAIVAVAGNDERGVLFGVGRLLRELRMNRLKVEIPSAYQETSAP